jgi:hypothetical protein
MTLFGLAMDQVFACDGMGIQFGSMVFILPCSGFLEHFFCTGRHNCWRL